MAIERVCKLFRTISSQKNELWKPLCQQKFGVAYKEHNETWHQALNLNSYYYLENLDSTIQNFLGKKV
ncbi:MAG: hypothetical protein JHC93_03005 [Parachlamydiales bacterium]|nr:hypothetical protein [Parachlamydiales bacterium]